MIFASCALRQILTSLTDFSAAFVLPIPISIGGAVVQEMITRIQSNDYNVVISLSFVYSAMYIIIMLVVDILYGIIDPRIRLAKDGD